jgi:uncharacterized peroxidase-related enzyme
MPRINPIDSATANNKAASLLDAVQRALGTRPNLMTTMAHAPAALEAYLGFGKSLSSGKLGGALREQIALTVAGANTCEYCASAHTALAANAGVDEHERTANLEGLSGDPKVQAALRFVRAVVEKRGWIDNAELAAVRNAGYDDGEIVEIIANIAINIFTNYFNHIAKTEVDFPVVKVGQPVAA